MAGLWKRPGVLLGGVAIYAGVTFATFVTLYDPAKRSAAVAAPMTDLERLRVFDANASAYDRDLDWDERLSGISLLRRLLLRNARGNVLEVAAGTGRNLGLYPKATQLTLTDLSSGMLQQAAGKRRDQIQSCDLQVMRATDLSFSDGHFDTVVDTFGLCSMDDSVQALKEMQRVCSKDGGRILLLEHGQSSYRWLASVLDKFADLHAQKWGCHWNRDILAMVEQAGLEVETVRRFHFGTTYYIVAKPGGSCEESSV
ncbi:Methyltransferase-like protein 7B [Phytophthora boehmeriae]|uniref:Methyltransferase-like protein 7B n=1 Tax=Phytophthora boehmeriae TaxID=109152 RepID=A0A8T1VAK8_9STRA|nr:Methyltransferase-like protein 7B [Phytophthora boehmeriae]